MKFTPRPLVIEFAKVMEQKLACNEHKESWENLPVLWFLDRIEEELRELREALFHETPNHVSLEAADVANFLMMLASVYGDIGTTIDRGFAVAEYTGERKAIVRRS